MTPYSFDPGHAFTPGDVSPGFARAGAVSPLTVKLGRGKHTSSKRGVCVMELASMLAEEPFTDHPASVCPVIACFLRAYNDSIDDQRRQDLYEYASKVVGSRACEAAERARAERLAAWAAERLAAWAAERQRRRWTRLVPPSALRRLGLDRQRPSHTPSGADAVRAIGRHTDVTHAEVLELIDELLTLDPDEGASSTAADQTTLHPADARARQDRQRAAVALVRPPQRHLTAGGGPLPSRLPAGRGPGAV